MRQKARQGLPRLGLCTLWALAIAVSTSACAEERTTSPVLTINVYEDLQVRVQTAKGETLEPMVVTPQSPIKLTELDQVEGVTLIRAHENPHVYIVCTARGCTVYKLPH